ncbi:oligopeptide transporter [Tanacetum coccineum]
MLLARQSRVNAPIFTDFVLSAFLLPDTCGNFNKGKNMSDIDINTLTIEQCIALIRDNNRLGVVKLEIGNDVDFEIKIHFMKELRRNLFASTKDEDAYEHVRRLRVFPITLTGAALRWKNMLPTGSITTWDLLEKAFIWRYCPPFKIARKLEEIQNFKQAIRQGSNDSSDDIDIQKLKENIHAIQVSCTICEGTHLTQECPIKNESKNVNQVKYIGFLEETVNKYCEESIKEQAAIDEWIRKFIENTDLNLKKLDAVTKSLEVKVEKLTQEVLTNEGNTVKRVKENIEKVREVKKEPVPRDLPIVNPYVPPVPSPGRSKEQEDGPYITRESVYTIGFSKRIIEEDLELLIAKDTQSSIIEIKAHSCIMNTYEKSEPFINTQ